MLKALCLRCRQYDSSRVAMTVVRFRIPKHRALGGKTGEVS